MSDLSATVVQSPHADATMAGDRAAIFHRESRKAITLNPTGTVLWNSLTRPTSGDDLVKILQREYPSLDEARATADVAHFLQELSSHQLIVEA